MKRFIAIIITATVLALVLCACTEKQNNDNADTLSYTFAEEETIPEYHTSMKWNIADKHYDYYPSDVKEVDRYVTLKVFVDEYKSSVTKYDIRDLYMEILQLDPDNKYISHTVLIYFDENSAYLSDYGNPDVTIEPIVPSYERHDAEATGYLGTFIITNSGVVSPSVTN